MDTGNELKEWRLQRGLSQEAAGIILGVSQVAVGQWERQNAPLHIQVGQRLAKYDANPKDYERPAPMPQRRRPSKARQLQFAMQRASEAKRAQPVPQPARLPDHKLDDDDMPSLTPVVRHLPALK